jgi:hypothetical protein
VKYADALATITEGMLAVHEQTCDIEGRHRWMPCTATPTVYGVADALDVLQGPDALTAPALSVALLPAVERALHDRECASVMCGSWDRAEQDAHAHMSWAEQAAALLAFVSARREVPPPLVASVRGDLLARCACGCIRRNHSVDGSRCYRCPVCMPEGGFRRAG